MVQQRKHASDVCDKVENYKWNCQLTKVEKDEGFHEGQSHDGKSLQEEKGDLYLASSGTQSNHDSWLIEFGS